MTVRQIAESNGYSKSTVFKDLTDRLPKIDISLYNKVRHVLNYHKSIRHVRGGKSTAKKSRKKGVQFISNYKNLTIDNKNLAKWKAQKWFQKTNHKYSYEELLCECNLGLVKAAKTFNKNLGNTFATYANTCMDNQIKMKLRKDNNRNSITITTLTPDNDEIDQKRFERMIFKQDCKIDELINLLVLKKFFENIKGISIKEIIHSNKNLNKKQRDKIIFLLSIKGVKQQVIANIFNLSQSYISRIIKKIRKEITKQLA